MNNSWILPFLTDHPFAAAWPAFLVACVLGWWAYLFTDAATNSMNLILRLSTLAANTFVISIRGYAPQSVEAAAETPSEPTNET